MGLDPLALEMLQALSPKQILYISCNPETQVKNIAALKDYTIETVQPVDQFPHTRHIENIVVLSCLF
jgi:23S rRNA (uracil1939-C5)-methyltransferase